MFSMTVKTWLSYSVSMTRSDRGGQAMTSSCLVATSYFAHSARLLARTARVLEENDGAEHYHALADSIRDDFLGKLAVEQGQKPMLFLIKAGQCGDSPLLACPAGGCRRLATGPRSTAGAPGRRSPPAGQWGLTAGAVGAARARRWRGSRAAPR
ncbi:hypothetical protein ACFVXA_29865 [Streptomyces sp. NPDC058246]|uniref:alpha-L-rhamnosidase-related protein n=1 Tax=Streptomyces sp. NPDC058246 TaxID=3346400 RepID=UPI0036E8C071